MVFGRTKNKRTDNQVKHVLTDAQIETLRNALVTYEAVMTANAQIAAASGDQFVASACRDRAASAREMSAVSSDVIRLAATVETPQYASTG